jgi:hypothetical protein
MEVTFLHTNSKFVQAELQMVTEESAADLGSGLRWERRSSFACNQ